MTKNMHDASMTLINSNTYLPFRKICFPGFFQIATPSTKNSRTGISPQ